MLHHRLRSVQKSSGIGARYWRILATNTSWALGGYQITFMRLSFYESLDATGTDANLGATASASNALTGYEASKANDNDNGTRWDTSGQASPQWWKVDYGAGVQKTIRSLQFYDVFAGYYPTQFKLQYSTDDAAWTDVATINTVNSVATQTFTNLQ